MAAKSISQRVVELVAVVAVFAFGAMIVRSIWSGRPQAEIPPSVAPNVLPPAPVPAPQPPADPGASLAPVDSVAKLPDRYPRIEELKTLPPLAVTPEGLNAVPNLEPADQHLLEAAKVRHLNAYQAGLIALDPGGKHAVVMEATPASTTRLALWDLSTGKLVRFLSMARGQQPRLYGGKENDDFGAVVDTKEKFFVFAVSPRGERLAARLSGGRGDATYYFWDLPTGVLLSTFHEVEEARGQLQFAGEDYAAISVVLPDHQIGSVRIHVATGEADLLGAMRIAGQLPMFSLAGFDGGVAYLDEQDIHVYQVERTHRRISAARGPKGTFRAFFATPDGSKLIALNSDLEIEQWEMPSGERAPPKPLAPRPAMRHSMLPAFQAGLLAGKEGERMVYVYDLETGKLASVIQTPFQRGELIGLSSDARRLVFSTDQATLLVVDLPEKLPAGVVNLVDLLPKEKLAATR